MNIRNIIILLFCVNLVLGVFATAGEEIPLGPDQNYMDENSSVSKENIGEDINNTGYNIEDKSTFSFWSIITVTTTALSKVYRLLFGLPYLIGVTFNRGANATIGALCLGLDLISGFALAYFIIRVARGFNIE